MRRRTVLQGLAASAGASLISSAWSETKPGRWLRLESPNFIVYTTEWDVRSRNELIALERFNALLSRMMPHEDQAERSKLTIYVLGSRRDFDIGAPGMPAEVAGFYLAGLEQTRAVSLAGAGRERQRDMPRNVRAMDSRVILFHEYAHHFSRANVRVSYPAWYQEGFAEFLSTAEFEDGYCDLGKFTSSRGVWLAYGDWMPIDTFLSKNTWEMTGEENAQFYAQAWLAAHYLFFKPERAKGFTRYCAALQADGDPIEAFEPAFGITPAAFDKELRDYKATALNIVRLRDSAENIDASITMTKLDNVYDNLLMPASYLRSLPSADEAKAAVEAIRKESKKFPADAFANRTAALAEIWYGDLTLARKQLDALLVTDTQSAETLHLSGLCDLRMGYAADDGDLIKKARKSFAGVQKLDPTRAISLYRYVEAYLNEANEVTPHLMDVLVAAYNRAPQVDEIALVAAQALMIHDRFEEAGYILQPMVGDIHSRGKSSIAMTLLKTAQAGKAEYFSFFGSAKDPL